MQGNEELKKRQILSAQIDLSKFNKGDFIKATEEEKKQQDVMGESTTFFKDGMKRLKKNPRMHIPIIGNGDITTPQRAKECFDLYGVDAIMIGRASFGRPWIFKEIKHYIETGKELPALSFEWRLNVLRQEVLDSVNLLDERRGILHVRRHLAASPLFKGIPNFKETRIAMLRAETVKELFSILDYIRGNYGMNC